MQRESSHTTLINIYDTIINKNKLLKEPVYFAFKFNHGYTTTKWNISNKIHNKTIECKCDYN